MAKKYIVRLTDEEREVLEGVRGKYVANSEKARRAFMLLKADADGPNWTDARIAEAVSCRVQTIENVRKRFVLEGFEASLNRKKRAEPPRAKLLTGEQEAEIIALRLGKPPAGFANWTLRLLTEQVVALEIVDSVGRETVRKTLKKTA
jgi:hypothetical protein